MYIHEQNDWPEFRWKQATVEQLLAQVRYRQGLLLGRMESLGFDLGEQASLKMLTQDVLKTSEIEGEKLDAGLVRSSLARRLGMDIGAAPVADRQVEGIVEVMLDATRNYAAPVTDERLFGWQAALFPTGRSGLRRITTGGWRTAASGPMQVVSGPLGRERIHFEAPEAERLPLEMACFLQWLNAPNATDPLLISAVAHFWFVTIHPFEDGNGRIARALADLLLARAEGSSRRFYSLSAQIQAERQAYYDVLEHSQNGTLDITGWVEWYLQCLDHAIAASAQTLALVLRKAGFWKTHAGEPFNERQRAMLNRLLDGFTGKLTTSKWAKLGKCSQDTALRDISDLLQRRILVKEAGGGRSSGYLLWEVVTGKAH